MTDDDITGSVTPEKLVERLRSALARDGDFPASAQAVLELQKLADDPNTTGNQVAEVILREPSLGTRVLHIVNSAFFRRGKPIMTVSQAVVQIGMKPLADLCSGLILLQRFVPLARRGGAFEMSLQQTILTSLLSKAIGSAQEKKHGGKTGDELGFLAGSFAGIGTLLLAYYFPKVYEAAAKRAHSKGVRLSQGILEVTGLTPLKLSLEVVDALKLPSFYVEVLKASEALGDQVDQSRGQKSSIVPPPLAPPQIVKTANAVTAATEVSRTLTEEGNAEAMEKSLSSLSSVLKIDQKAVASTLANLSEVFENHCNAIELQLPALPEFVSQYTESGDLAPEPTSQKKTVEDDQFKNFIDEIREAVDNQEPTASVITSVLETLAWGLKFDRVILLLLSPNRRQLLGRMALGNLGELVIQTMERPIGPDADRFAPDAKALEEGRPIFNGDPVLDGGWPLAAIPIGQVERSIGVIYADRVNSNSDELTGKEQAAIGVLGELLDRSISMS